jgi:hypothetical protein
MDPITEMEAHPITDAAPAAEVIKAKPTTSWRDLIKVHPAADAFPMMSFRTKRDPTRGYQGERRRTQIATWVAADRVVGSDGRNRSDAMAAAGYTSSFATTSR